jgi:hypothetical protein
MLANDLELLIQDIYKETGQKVEINDPIVSAALIQSRLIKDAIVNVKETLPNEISKQVLLEIKKDVNDAKFEMLDVSKKHKEMLEKLHNKTVDSIDISINRNTESISMQINNNLWYLCLFGLFCGFTGGIVVCLAQIYL